MTTAMAPPETPAGDDEFSAFESGISEYESAGSNGAPSEDAGVGAAASNEEGDDFFDAFAEADGATSAEEGGGGDTGEPLPTDVEEGADGQVDIFNSGATSVQPAQGEDPSPPDEDPFSAFDDIGEPLGVPGADEENAFSDDFGVFGSAEGDAPNTIADAPLSPEPATTPENGDEAEEKGDDQLLSSNPEAPEDPTTLTAGDSEVAQLEPEQKLDEVHVDAESDGLKSIKEGENGGSSDLLSAFDALGVQDAPLPSLDALGVQDAPLPSLDSFAPSGNGESIPEVTDGKTEGATVEQIEGNVDEPPVENEANVVEADSDKPIQADASSAANVGGLESHGMAGAGDLAETSTSQESDPLDAIQGQSENGEAAQEIADKGCAVVDSTADEGDAILDGEFGGFVESAAKDTQDEPGTAIINGGASNEPLVASDDDFGGFSTFDEVRTSPPLEEEPPASQIPAPDDDDFGGFSTFECEPSLPCDDFGHFASPEDYQAQMQAEELKNGDQDDSVPTDGLGAEISTEINVESTASEIDAEEENAPENDYAAEVPDDDDFGGFSTFPEDTPVASEPAAAAETTAAAIEEDEDVEGLSSAFIGASDELGAGEDAAPPEVAPAESDQQSQSPAEVEAPPADADDGFGDFGDFTAGEEPTVEASPDSVSKKEVAPHETLAAEGEPAPQPSVDVSTGDDDGFGDFGDFNTFEEAPEEAIPENAHTESDQHVPEGQAAPSEPPAVASQADDDDEFGDFGDFDAFEEAPAKDDTPTEAPLSVLNENVRSMFDDVFASDTSIDESEICTELPFYVPMSELLPEQMPSKEEDAADSHRSEQELAKMKQYFEDLPRSTPVTILSDEKWYPYSQYEFHRDGSPYADSVEHVTTPSVPEVLSIDLPTGFEASNLSPTSKPKHSSSTTPPAASSYRNAPTVVDFPSTPKSESKVATAQPKAEESNEVAYSQLSDVGKRFLDQLPDLSYMLKSTLSLPGDKK